MKRTIVVITLLVSMLSTLQAQDVKPFLGRWGLYLPGGAGWLEVRQEEGYLDADILWYGGSVVPVDYVYMDGDQLIVTRIREMVRERDEDKNPTRTQYRTELLKFSRYDEILGGMRIQPEGNGIGVNTTKFVAKKIPPLPPAPNLNEIQYGEPIKLFNGKDLSGWKLVNPDRTNGFKAEDGVLVNKPVQKEGEPRIHYGNLRTVKEFEDFNLQIDVKVPERSNSGIYLRGIYEVQVADTYGRKRDSHNMGAIYSRITPSVSAEKPAGEWQHFDITLCDRHVTVVLNGTEIIDNKPLYGVTGGALTADQLSPGPIYLQGDHGKIYYRNIILKPVIEK